MPGHHLILAPSMQHRVHNRPRRRSLPPAALRFFFWQRDYGAPSNIYVQRTCFNKHAAPENLARLADPLQRPAAEWEIHGRLPLAARAAIATDKMICRRCSGDLKNPYKIVEPLALIVLPPSNIVQRSRRVKPQRRPAAVRNQSIHAGTFIYLIEMHQRPTR